MSQVQKIFEAQQANRWKVAATNAAERIIKLKKIREAIFTSREELQKAILEFQKRERRFGKTSQHIQAGEKDL